MVCSGLAGYIRIEEEQGEEKWEQEEEEQEEHKKKQEEKQPCVWCEGQPVSTMMISA